MNILFLSNVKGIPSAGPTYSVPNRILAQQKYDNVFWYNTCAVLNDDWIGQANYHDLREYPSRQIRDLPAPFNRPDVIVVEQFYNHSKDPYLKEVMASGIPYIIVPRSELTKQGQARHRWKKIAANALRFKKFARKAAAIQYLTQQEKTDSGDGWNKNGIVIPNGIRMPEPFSKSPSDTLRCVSIGRLEPYQKGLDLLLAACVMEKDALVENKVRIDLYGTNKEGKGEELARQISEAGLEGVMSVHPGVFGEEKKQVLRNSDVFIMTSRFEGHPMALIEALSYGLPAVATTGSNMREEIEKARAGWGCDIDARSIARALLEMTADGGRSEKAENARRLAGSYDWDAIARQTSDALRTIAGSCAGPASRGK